MGHDSVYYSGHGVPSRQFVGPSEVEEDISQESGAEIDIDEVVYASSQGGEWMNGMSMTEDIPDILENDDEWVDQMISEDAGDETAQTTDLVSDKSWIGLLFETKEKLKHEVNEWSMP